MHIRRLREKIEETPPSRALSQTVWGVGYRFVAVIVFALLVAASTLRRRRPRRPGPAPVTERFVSSSSAWRSFAVVLPLAAVVVAGVLMFRPRHDLTVLVVAAGAAGGRCRRCCSTRSISAGGGSGAWCLRGSWRAVIYRPHARVRAAGSPTLGAAFNRMARSSQRLFEARRELVAQASHDLRTPLASSRRCSRPWRTGSARQRSEYLPAMGDQVRRPRPARQRPLRADAHRRR